MKGLFENRTGLLVGYFTKRQEAEKALRRLRRAGFTRAFLAGPAKDSTAGIGFFGGIALRRVLFSIGLPALLVVLPPAVLWYVGVSATWPQWLFLLGIGLLLGGFVRLFLTTRSDREVLKRYAGYAVGEETVLLVRAAPERLEQAFAVLRGTGAGLFSFLPVTVFPYAAPFRREEPLSLGGLVKEARALGRRHKRAEYGKPKGDLRAELRGYERALRSARRRLALAARLEGRLSPSAEWLLDNAHIIQAQIDDVRLNLPAGFYRDLPFIAAGEGEGKPRIREVADLLVRLTDGQIDRNAITTFLEAYQEQVALTIGELWALPLMLRVALIERLAALAATLIDRLGERRAAEFWANRLLAAARSGGDAGRLFGLLADLAAQKQKPSTHFAFQLFEHLYDEEALLTPVRAWLERTLGEPLTDLTLHEQTVQAANQVTVGNIVTTLRRLTLTDWREVFDQLSLVEGVLREDPIAVYGRMDFDSRDRYRHAVEELARRSGQEETEVARLAVDLASEGAGRPPGEAGEAPCYSHVGYYLVDEGRRFLVQRLGCTEALVVRARQWASRHSFGVYVGSIVLLTVLIAGALAGTFGGNIPLGLVLGLIPASQLAVLLVNYTLTRLMPPRLLAKYSFESTGIPDGFRTLVVVPTLLVDRRSVLEEIRKLEVRYLANPEPNLLFALFTDWTDAPHMHMKDDEQLLEAAVAGIEELNRRYGAGRFFLFHRDRVWTESEQCYLGWERKRGKLEVLNRLLSESAEEEAQEVLKVGDPALLRDVRFVITLDSDTQLPRDTARRLVETLAHPLNQARFSADGSKIVGGYVILQPRVSVSLPSATATRFSRLFTYPVGVDPYTKAVSDVYQDLAGEASYMGKGIYDVRAFHRILCGRFPEQTLLSHDLIEGAHLRVGLVSDIELFDEFPPDYTTYVSREHRWIRGDWQIADWCTPWVPGPDGRKRRNPINAINRWKIFDNLRRSLLAPSLLVLLIGAALLGEQAAFWASVLAGVILFFPPLSDALTYLTTPVRAARVPFDQALHGLVRSAAEVILLPHLAVVVLDAIVRVWYRRLVSRRYLLQWTTAQVAARLSRHRQGAVLLQLTGIAAAAVAGGFIGFAQGIAGIAVLTPFLCLWAASPLLIWYLSRPEKRRAVRLSTQERAVLRRSARRTWQYFLDFVTESTSFLPPDNFQESFGRGMAMRTSPTNIGLGLVAEAVACDFGYTTIDEAVSRLVRSLGTVDKLERFEGHLFNWYDLETLKPLEPRYVSTVDSGNFLAALWVLERSVEELIDRPVFDRRAFDGIQDTFSVFLEAAGPLRGEAAGWAGEIRALLENVPAGLEGRINCMRALGEPSWKLAQALEGVGEEAAFWARELHRHVADWNNVIDRYLLWYEIGRRAGMERIDSAPSLAALCEGLNPVVPGALAEEVSEDARRQILQELEKAKWLAGEKRAEAVELCRLMRRLGGELNLGFLYDPEQRLFRIGFNVQQQRHDGSVYDLLASEARLASFVGIARGEVPVRHWFALGRPFGAVGGRRVLLSWSGTMFEYLLPLLFQKAFENSLLAKACEDAVAVQIRYARKRKVPWGISESAYSDLDAHRVYQYRAFGVPGLGLKRGLENELVVAPYASLLAVPFAPREAVRNLRRLAALGLQGRYGWYEAIDFTRRRREGEVGIVVHAYMAHHQAMGLLALANFFHNNALQNRFHARAQVEATEPLLYERIPIAPPIQKVAVEERGPSRVVPEEIAPTAGSYDTPHTSVPAVHLLSNGRYHVMVTSAGGGYSRWQDVALTRWTSDTTCDSGSVFCYIRDLKRNSIWSTGYLPIRSEPAAYNVSFPMDRAEFRRRDGDIETETLVLVDPEEDVELRRITLINRSGEPAELEVTSYLEPVLAPHEADRQHPAFNKLFIKTEAVRGGEILLATRRPRGPDEKPIYFAHALVPLGWESNGVSFETDRVRFLGRGRDPGRPAALTCELSNTAGYVLDPILSIRRRVVVPPNQRREFVLVNAVGDTRERARALAERYRDPQAVTRASEMAWSHAQLELRHLRIQPDEARRFQQLASALLYPHARFRAPAERLARNRLNQTRLWPYGISGDLPVVVVRIGELRDLTVVRQILQAHTFWRLRGLKVDLVILNDEPGGYERPLNDRLRRLVEAHAVYTGMDEPGGIYLRSTDQLSEEDLTLLLSCGRVVLVAARGTLAQQLAIPEKTAPYPEKLVGRPAEEEPSGPLPFLELPYFNGLGGFTRDGKEYAVYLGPHSWTPAPWVNVIANPKVGTLVSESGGGFSWYGNSQQNRLTGWSNDPVSDRPSEVVYVRDEESGRYWSVTALPIRELDAYRARHGAGYTVFEHNSHAIEQELVVFVPVRSPGDGDPVIVKRLRLRNDGSRVRKLSVTFYAELVLGEHREVTQQHVVTAWDARSRSVIATNRYHQQFGGFVAFATTTPPPHTCTADRTEFIGRNRTLANPEALSRVWLSGKTGAGLDPCWAFQVKVDLAPGEETQIAFLMGQARSVEEVRDLVTKWRDFEVIEAGLAETKAFWDEILGAVQVRTPILSVDFMLNRWLLYQTLSCRIWGRSGFYQSSGAFGFRDQLQDVLALLIAAPEIARTHILQCCGRQFREGDVQHWWHPVEGGGVRTRCSDDLLWLPYAVAKYEELTGDRELLAREVPFIEGPPLKPEERESYFVPSVSTERATVYEHCLRAVELGCTRGSHGVPLMGSCDWNDGLNLVGAKGSGESVWLGWFCVALLRDFARLAERLGDARTASRLRAKARRYAAALERHCWDGNWYLRAYFDDGSPLGSRKCAEAKIDSLPQSWAAISRAGRAERRREALESAWKELVREEEQLALLFTPPFDSSSVEPGYIKGYPPGVRENGGQYTHAAAWLALAYALEGEAQKAVSLLTMLNPVEHARDEGSTALYRVEPYVVAADVYFPPAGAPGSIRPGQGGWTWYTGSAGWLYRAWLEGVFGLRLREETLRFEPCLPPDWKEVGLSLRWGEAIYEITLENPSGGGREVAYIELDGKRLAEKSLRLSRERVKHKVLVSIGK